MTIYLGESGHVELQRQGAVEPYQERASFFTRIEPEDVNVDARRFSFLGASLSLITGDKIEIERVGSCDPTVAESDRPLELVENHDYPDWLGYVNVDAIGGIRLYTDFNAAIEGDKNNALQLVEPSSCQRIRVTSRDNTSRCIAQIRSYEVTTQRETIDVTSLQQQYRNFYHQGLISGQGRLDCFWEHTRENDCPPDRDLSLSEYTAYLAHLCIRLVQGASFFGRFYIYDGGIREKSVWYEAQCIVTNVVVNVEPGQIIGTTIDFITTGPVRLMTGIPPAYLLKEEGDFILQENGDRLQVSIDD